MNEVVDLSPDYFNLRQIFRQVKPAYLVAAGTNQFFEDLSRKLLEIPENTDIEKYKVHKTKSSNAFAFNVCFFPLNRQTANRERIYELDLPGLPVNCSASERQIFVDSVFPMSKETFTICMSNLLRYLRENHLKWRHVYMNLDKNPIISNIVVFHLESQVIVDEGTFNALNIFSNVYHPSSFKAQIRHDGLSLFNFLNQCCSSIGVKELKAMLMQPTRDIVELNLRFSTVEWCLNPSNFDHVKTLRNHLKNVLSFGKILTRISLNYGRSMDWKSFKKTVYSCYLITEMCGQFSEESIRDTYIFEIGRFAREDYSIKGILYALDMIVDLAAVEVKKRFIVKDGLHAEIDEKRKMIEELIETQMNMELDESLSQVNTNPDAFHFVYYPEVGFVIATELKPEEMNLNAMQENNIEVILKTVDAAFLRTPNCQKLNNEYERLLTEMIGHEMKVFKDLMKYINENQADLITLTNLCAKIDVLICFASVAAANQFVKPTVTIEKELEIINGRHPLVEKLREFVPSTTIVNRRKNNLVNIINAPNASGKSVYIKKIALICFMAHIGMFVPAESCSIPLLHSIYTRVHTPESIYQCESAFLADLQQMSKVIMQSTSRSLVIVDEFGKGTSFRDGLALLVASIEHFISRGDQSPITFISTHFNHIQTIIDLKDIASFKTIVTRRNEVGIYESVFQVAEGINDQSFSTENPESNLILGNILNEKEKLVIGYRRECQIN